MQKAPSASESTTPTTTTAERFVDGREIIVRITVNSNDTLELFPHEVSVFCHKPGATPPSPWPDKPIQVRWVVIADVPVNRSVQVMAKTPGTGCFLNDEFQIPGGYNSIVSGPAQQEMETGWNYSVFLKDEKGNPLFTIDPSVIIKQDP